jgi:hypothetical protein
VTASIVFLKPLFLFFIITLLFILIYQLFVFFSHMVKYICIF